MRLRWKSACTNAHRNVYNNFGQSRSDKIMGGLSQEDVEAFLHVTMVAILADCNFYNNSVTKR